jgi:signal transduction histidine kinase
VSLRSSGNTLNRIRIQLTIWYAATLLTILLLLSAGLVIVVRHQLSRELDDSLAFATSELVRIVTIEGSESSAGETPYLAATNELRIPGVTLYVLEASGRPVAPGLAASWIRQAGRAAAASGIISAQIETLDDRTLRIHARSFGSPDGRQLVAAAEADQVELENRYADLIAAFAGAAALALVMVAAGAWILVRKSIAPVVAVTDNMRRFIADAAHELKTPVAVLRAHAEVALHKDREPEAYRSTLRMIETEAERLGAIIERLLLLSRADAGERKVAQQNFYLDDVASEAFAETRAIADRSKVHLEMKGFEEATVNGDPSLIREMILIFLDNAVKFTPAGGRVSLEIGNDGHPELTVRDTGIGIAPQHMSRVFDRFYRADTSRDRAGGAGLGLSIAKWIADQHHAQILLTSSEGTGTTVTVAFPPSHEVDRPLKELSVDHASL